MPALLRNSSTAIPKSASLAEFPQLKFTPSSSCCQAKDLLSPRIDDQLLTLRVMVDASTVDQDLVSSAAGIVVMDAAVTLVCAVKCLVTLKVQVTRESVRA